MAHAPGWLRNQPGGQEGPGGASLAGDLSPRPGDGAQHDGKGTGSQGGEEAEVQRALHAIVAHAHHRIQVVLKRSNAKYSTMSNNRSSNLRPRTDKRSIIHEGKRSRECRRAGSSLYSRLVEKSGPLFAFSPPSLTSLLLTQFCCSETN